MVAEKASDVLQKKYEEKPTSTLEDIDRQWTEELMAFKVADRTTGITLLSYCKENLCELGWNKILAYFSLSSSLP